MAANIVFNFFGIDSALNCSKIGRLKASYSIQYTNHGLADVKTITNIFLVAFRDTWLIIEHLTGTIQSKYQQLFLYTK